MFVHVKYNNIGYVISVSQKSQIFVVNINGVCVCASLHNRLTSKEVRIHK